MEKEVILSVKNLKSYYPILGGLLKRKKGEVLAVNDVSFNLKKGETLGLVGESGCGKTTIANTILNLVPITSGDIFYKNRKIEYSNFPKILRKTIQIVFQDPDAALNSLINFIKILNSALASNSIICFK